MLITRAQTTGVAIFGAIEEAALALEMTAKTGRLYAQGWAEAAEDHIAEQRVLREEMAELRIKQKRQAMLDALTK